MNSLHITLRTAEGLAQFNASAIYEKTKASFLADYADDPAVLTLVYRDGDLAEMEVKSKVSAIDIEQPQFTIAQVESGIAAIGRLALVSLCLINKKTRKRQ